MSVTNHKVMRGNLDIALIQGTTVEAYCGIEFVPTLQVGSSGRADVPGARSCPDCNRLQELHLQYAKNRDEYNRIAREQRALQKEFKKTRVALRADRNKPVEVNA